MLLRTATLEGIRDGRITLAFRRWRRPTVRSGGTLLTALGELEIREVREITLDAVTDDDARAAGFDARPALVAELESRGTGRVFRIAFGSLRADPRIALRERSDLTDEEMRQVAARLARMDARSREGPWTLATLRLIAAHPEVRAGDLCTQLHHAKDRFKGNVRKLKGMGLTESLGTGYRLSPRGRVVLSHLESASPGGG